MPYCSFFGKDPQAGLLVHVTPVRTGSCRSVLSETDEQGCIPASTNTETDRQEPVLTVCDGYLGTENCSLTIFVGPENFCHAGAGVTDQRWYLARTCCKS